MKGRAFFCDLKTRSINEELRQAEFVAATENPVDTWYGREYLDMTGVDLTRFQKNPIVLDSHKRGSLRDIIGQADIKAEGRELWATITFSKSEIGNLAWDLVKSDIARAVSIGYGYSGDDIEELREGEVAGAFTGPCLIVRKWELYELSIVPVPADPDALKRESGRQEIEDLAPVVRDLQEQVKRLTLTKEAEGKNLMGKEDDKTREPAQVPSGGDGGATDQFMRDAESVKVLRDALLCICPRGFDLEKYVEGIALKAKDFTDGKAQIIALYEKQLEAVGTPEPPTKTETKTETPETRQLKDISDKELAAAFCGR